MDGIVVIGEGEKDDAPMLFNGEHVGDGSAPEIDVAVDPIDGTTLTAQGKTTPCRSSPSPIGARCSIRARRSTWSKIAVGPDAVGSIDITATRHPEPALDRQVQAREVRDLTVVILDRPRHADLIAEVRASGAGSG